MTGAMASLVVRAVIDLSYGPAATEEKALDSVAAAWAAASESREPGITPELLLGIAHVESRFRAAVVSRIQGGRRRSGVWTKRRAPGSGPYFCGPTQVTASTWPACLSYIDDRSDAFRKTVAELEQWMADRRCRRKSGLARVTCALQGYVGGYAAIGRNHRYPASVRAAAAKVTEAWEASS